MFGSITFLLENDSVLNKNTEKFHKYSDHMFHQTGCDYSKIRNVFINVVIIVVDGHQMGKQLLLPNLFDFPGVLWEYSYSFNIISTH